MRTIELQFSGHKSLILIDYALSEFQRLVPSDSVIITDENVQRIYGHLWSKYRTIVISPGEESKSIETYTSVCLQLLRYDIDRGGFIAGIGGGVVGDLAGFVASTYYRGLRFGLVPTTLLAQADAAIGGKNGLNFNGFKNILGTFHQPEFIICDPGVLTTLPHPEISCGLAEIIKHALIADSTLLDFIETNARQLYQLERKSIVHAIERSVKIKSSFVNEDERDRGVRRILNFGHTVGHAIEQHAGLPHGYAVALGMIFAVDFSVRRGYLAEVWRSQIRKLLLSVNLPVQCNADRKEIFRLLLRDKKRENARLHFIFLEKAGKARIDEITPEEIHSLLMETEIILD